jgi:Phosphotransferase enzyme family
MKPDIELIQEALGEPVVGWAPAHERGHTDARRWRVRTSSGPRFVKEAGHGGALEMLRRETLVYRHVEGPFMAGFAGFADAGDRACLAIELLDRARWPPPYPDDTRPLFVALEQIAESTPPPGLPRRDAPLPRWERVGADPEPFLALGLCSSEWLEHSLDDLIAAKARAVVTGDDLIHNDVYSGNLCFDGERAIVVDWGAACRGKRRLDVAFARLGIRVAGGRVPRVDLPDEDALVAWIAGGHALGVTAPLPDWADPGSTLRDELAGDLAVALPWLADALGLPPPLP